MPDITECYPAIIKSKPADLISTYQPPPRVDKSGWRFPYLAKRSSLGLSAKRVSPFTSHEKPNARSMTVSKIKVQTVASSLSPRIIARIKSVNSDAKITIPHTW